MSSFTRRLRRLHSVHAQVGCFSCDHVVVAHRMHTVFDRHDNLVLVCGACRPAMLNAYFDRIAKRDREKEEAKADRKAKRESKVVLPWAR